MTIAPPIPACERCTVGPYRVLGRAQMSRLIAGRLRFSRHGGEVIYQQDAASLSVYCVHSGSVELFRQKMNGKDAVIGTCQAGDLFGFESALAGLPYGTTAITLEPSVICAIPSPLFVDLLSRGPNLGARLLETMCRRWLVAQSDLAARTHARVAERLAGLLLDSGTRGGEGNGNGGALRVSMPRETMARLLGTTPETLSRALHRLAATGVLELEGRRGIVVRDPSVLEDLRDNCPVS